ncbi:MFS transporter [Nocardia sp. NPDC004168]|uniref:MFS transporter n=1 Tax=Nocardia sp. NPDC004168 TaxID=3154452 RepID=UPI0033BAD573
MSSALPPAGTPGRARHLGSALILLAFAQLIISVDYNIVFIAMPEIGRKLNFSSQTLQWVISGYAVIFGGFLLLGGRASDLLGRRRMFVLGLLIYAAASLAGGLATEPVVLVTARGLQGVGGALLFPATLSLVNTLFAEGRERNRALAVWSAAGAGGLILGSLLGGLLTELFGWRAVFYVNVPLAVVAALLAFPLISPDAALDRGRHFDLPGALTATLGVTLLVFALVQGPEFGWLSAPILSSVLVAAVLIASFVVIEHRSVDPLLPLRLFGNRSLSTSVMITFLFTATFGSLLYFLALFFQNVRGYSPMESGVAFLVPMAVVLSGNAIGGKLLTSFGVRVTLLISLMLLAIGTIILALEVKPTGSYLTMLPGLVIFAIGGGITFPAMFAAAATGVEPREQGIASAIASTGQQIGAAIGLAILVVIANAGTEGAAGDALRTILAENLRTTMFVAAAGVVAMVLLALNFPRATKSVEEPHSVVS